MDGRRALRSAGVALCAALGAALLAHVAIDAAGDYLLPHDAYDDIAHGSRGVAGAAFLGLLLAGVGGAARAALCRARGSVRILCEAVRSARPRNSAAFACAVLALALPLVLAMEGLDVALAGGTIDDPADLLGGSLFLGLSLTLLCACACAWFTRLALGRLGVLERAVARAVRFLCRAAARGAARPIARRAPHRPRAAVRFAVRRLAGRAPPRNLLAPSA